MVKRRKVSSAIPYNRDFRLLEIVGELHRMGHEQLRISAGVGPTGAWRCWIGSAKHFVGQEHGGCPSQMSSGYGYSRDVWIDQHDLSLRDLAQIFIEKYPEIAQESLGQDHDYVGWYGDMLRAASPSSVPFMYDDWGYFDKVVLLNVGTEIGLPPVAKLDSKIGG